MTKIKSLTQAFRVNLNLLVMWVGATKCKYNHHKDRVISYGYPAYHRRWITMKKCKRCGRLLRETDNLYAAPRPADYKFDLDYVNYEKEDGIF